MLLSPNDGCAFHDQIMYWKFFLLQLPIIDDFAGVDSEVIRGQWRILRILGISQFTSVKTQWPAISRWIHHLYCQRSLGLKELYSGVLAVWLLICRWEGGWTKEIDLPSTSQVVCEDVSFHRSSRPFPSKSSIPDHKNHRRSLFRFSLERRSYQFQWRPRCPLS